VTPQSRFKGKQGDCGNDVRTISLERTQRRNPSARSVLLGTLLRSRRFEGGGRRLLLRRLREKWKIHQYKGSCSKHHRVTILSESVDFTTALLTVVALPSRSLKPTLHLGFRRRLHSHPRIPWGRQAKFSPATTKLERNSDMVRREVLIGFLVFRLDSYYPTSAASC
jgi:hypothetical protein